MCSIERWYVAVCHTSPHEGVLFGVKETLFANEPKRSWVHCFLNMYSKSVGPRHLKVVLSVAHFDHRPRFIGVSQPPLTDLDLPHSKPRLEKLKTP